AGGTLTVTSSGGALTVSAATALALKGGSAFGVRLTDASGARQQFKNPTTVSTSSVTRAVLDTVSVSAGATFVCGIHRYRATVKGWPQAGGAGQETRIDVVVENVGGTLTKYAETITNTVGMASLGTVDVTVSGTSFTIG